MQKSFFALFSLFLFVSAVSHAQSEKHTWRAFAFGKTMQWYDASQLDTVDAVQFNLWIIELAPTAFPLEGFEKKVLRTKTLYTINTELRRYGIAATVYYDNVNREVNRIQYNNELLPAELRMPFPIMKNGIIDAVLQHLHSAKARRQ